MFMMVVVTGTIEQNRYGGGGTELENNPIRTDYAPKKLRLGVSGNILSQ